MHFPQPGFPSHLGDVLGSKPAAAEDDDTVASLPYQIRQRAGPSSAVSRWPLVSTRPTLQRISASSASAGSRVMSKARWQVTFSGPAACDQFAHARFVDGAVRGQAAEDHAGHAEFAQRATSASIEAIFGLA